MAASALLWPGVIGGGMLIDAILKFITGQREIGTQRIGLGLQGKQLEAAAGMGRRAEARSDKMIKKLLAHQDKRYLQERGRESQQALRSSQEQENEMAMTMIMALAGLNQQSTQTASRPPIPKMSMLNLMR
jgi:hypothetical protein